MWQSQEAEPGPVSSIQDNVLPHLEQKVTSDLTFLMFRRQLTPPTSHSRCESEQLMVKECGDDSALHMSCKHMTAEVVKETWKKKSCDLQLQQQLCGYSYC